VPKRLQELLLLASLLCLSSCIAEINEPSCECATGPVEDGWISLWEGHSYSWKDLSHRIAFLRAGVDLPGDDGSFDADLGILGGSWADGRNYRDHPSYTVAHSRVLSDDLVAWYGEVPILLGPEGRSSTEVVIDLATLDLPSRLSWTNSLRGICMDMDVDFLAGYDGSYAGKEGWTPRGFGVELSPLEHDDKDRLLRFTATAHFQGGHLDRIHHNEALEFAQVETRIRYALLGFNSGAVHPGQITASAFYNSAGERHSDIEPIPEAQRTLQIEGVPELPIGLPLLRGWDFELNVNDEDDKPGRYLREWAAQVQDFSYQANSGIAEVVINGYASHSSVIQEGDLEVDFRADIDLLQLADAEAIVVRGVEEGSQDRLGNWTHPVAPIED